MHELSIAMSIVEMAEEEAKCRGVQVVAVHLKVGALSGVVKEALLSCYEMACENTPLQGSHLLVEDVPVVIFCPKLPGRTSFKLSAVVQLSRMRRAMRGDCAWQGTRGGCPGDTGMRPEPRLIEVRKNVLKQNDVVARALRDRFRAAGVFVVSLVSSPGSGKTAFLEKTLTLLRPNYRVAALVGDLATENDALRLARSQAPVKQITTGTLCHLEAAMVQTALEEEELGSQPVGFPLHRKRR